MKFKNVLLASDLDGTLRNDRGEMTDDVKSAIRYFIPRAENLPSVRAGSFRVFIFTMRILSMLPCFWETPQWLTTIRKEKFCSTTE